MSRALCVDDNDHNLYMLKSLLERAGHAVIFARSGEEAVAVAEIQVPDLVLMDLNLPGIDGCEATRRLKAAVETRTIPIIALTAHAMAGDREKAIAAGADDYDTKPINLPGLLAKMDALLNKVAS